MEANSGSSPVLSSEAFNITRLQSHLESVLPGFSGPLTIEKFNGGQSNPTYKLLTPGRRYVLRSKPGPASQLLPSAHAIEREFKVMDALSGTDVPVPAMLHMCADESVIGRSFYVMDFVEGRVMWDQSLPALTVGERACIYEEMNRVIAALHSVNVEGIGLRDYGKPGNFIQRQIARWTRQYQASSTQPIDAMNRLIEWLPANIPATAMVEGQASIVHGDYRLDNLVFHPTEPRVVAVLDWELSTLGHPLVDFSYHCMSWHIPPGSSPGLGNVDLSALNIPDERSYVSMYCERMGRSDTAAVLQDWNFYLAFSMFRLASILQGIAKRVELGIASSAEAKHAAARARPMAELGLDFARQT